MDNREPGCNAHENSLIKWNIEKIPKMSFPTTWIRKSFKTSSLDAKGQGRILKELNLVYTVHSSRILTIVFYSQWQRRQKANFIKQY